MTTSLERKGAVGSLRDGVTWLRRNPILIGVFFLYGLLELFAEVLGPIGAVFGLVSYLVLLYIDGLVHVIGTQEVAGETVDIGAASATVLGRYLSLVGIAIVYFLVVTVGLLFFLLPGIYLAVRLVLAFPACVIDDRDAFASLSTSWDVANGNLMKLFGIFVVTFLVMIAAVAVTVSVTGLDEAFYLSLLAVAAVLTAVVSPVVQFAFARIYLENRPVDAISTTEGDTREDDIWGSTADDRTRTDRDDDRWDDANW